MYLIMVKLHWKRNIFYKREPCSTRAKLFGALQACKIHKMTWKLHKSALIMQIQISYYEKFCLRVKDHPHSPCLSLPSLRVSVWECGSHDGRQRYAHRAIQLALFANIIFAICQNAQKAHFYVVTFSIMATPNLLEEH